MFRMGVFSQRLSLLRSPAVFQFFLEASGLFPKQMAFKAKLESWGGGRWEECCLWCVCLSVKGGEKTSARVPGQISLRYPTRVGGGRSS